MTNCQFDELMAELRNHREMTQCVRNLLAELIDKADQAMGTPKPVYGLVNPTVKLILDLLQADPHSHSTRPCQTCTTVSQLAGMSFGCVKRAEGK